MSGNLTGREGEKANFRRQVTGRVVRLIAREGFFESMYICVYSSEVYVRLYTKRGGWRGGGTITVGTADGDARVRVY